jgi:thiamine-phosphate diphosphorylase
VFFPGRGVYPLLDIESCLARDVAPLALIETWLALGLDYCQLRAKHLDERSYLELAARLLSAAPAMRLLANDFVAALDFPASFSGLHLGQGDVAALGAADGLARLQERRRADPAFILGLSTHNLDQFAAALAAPGLWSYVALGPCFSRAGKRGATEPVLGADGVEKILRAAAGERRDSPGPCVVFIGGVTAENYAAVAGAARECGLRSVAAVIGSAFREQELQQILTISAGYNG